MIKYFLVISDLEDGVASAPQHPRRAPLGDEDGRWTVHGHYSSRIRRFPAGIEVFKFVDNPKSIQ